MINKHHYIYLIAVLIFITGCASNLKSIEQYENIAVIDFSKYSAKDFLITPEPYSKVYKSLGLMNLTTRAEATLNPEIKVGMPRWLVGSINISKMLDTAYSSAIDMGGDAIVNFRITPSDETYTDGVYSVTVPGIEISGFVIKRDH